MIIALHTPPKIIRCYFNSLTNVTVLFVQVTFVQATVILFLGTKKSLDPKSLEQQLKTKLANKSCKQ